MGVPPHGKKSHAPLRWRLREATAELHAALDAGAGQLRLDTRDGYRAFLTAQAQARAAVEPVLQRAGAMELLPDWPARRLGPALDADLADLGTSTPPAPATPFAAAGDEVWGALYVLEGSRLGGQVLRRQVLAAWGASPPPMRFLDAHDSRWWVSFTAALAASEARIDAGAAIAGAQNTFRVFEAAFAAVTPEASPARMSAPMAASR